MSSLLNLYVNGEAVKYPCARCKVVEESVRWRLMPDHQLLLCTDCWRKEQDKS
jgi:hypothetical protein